MPWLIVGLVAAVGLYAFTLRRTGSDLLVNGGFENLDNTFQPTQSSAMSVPNNSMAISGWQVRGTALWCQFRGNPGPGIARVFPKEGNFCVDLVNLSATGPTGTVVQGLLLAENRDF